MGKKNKSRSARRTGSPVGDDDDNNSDEYVITEESYEVECVVGHRMRRNGMEYKVRWRGWSEQFDEWLHHTKMDCPDAIQEYWDSVDHRKAGEKKSPQKEGAKKRERVSSTGSNQSQRRSIVSPPSKKGCPTEVEENEADVTITSTVEPLEEAVQETSKISSSSKKDKPLQTLDSLPTANQLLPGEFEDSASDGNPSPAIASTSFALVERASPSLSTSSTHSVPPVIIKRQIPRPPAIPKRKSTASLSNTSTSVTTPSVSGTSLLSETTSVPKVCPPPEPQMIPSLEGCKDGDELHENLDAPNNISQIYGKALVDPPPTHKEKPFVRPHGFERGLAVERIHGFIRRAGKIFAVTQFKNCDVIEILATDIVKHYEPLALIRGFEEHRIRCRRNRVLATEK